MYNYCPGPFRKLTENDIRQIGDYFKFRLEDRMISPVSNKFIGNTYKEYFKHVPSMVKLNTYLRKKEKT
jgi:hypothetical protein